MRNTLPQYFLVCAELTSLMTPGDCPVSVPECPHLLLFDHRQSRYKPVVREMDVAEIKPLQLSAYTDLVGSQSTVSLFLRAAQ